MSKIPPMIGEFTKAGRRSLNQGADAFLNFAQDVRKSEGREMSKAEMIQTAKAQAEAHLKSLTPRQEQIIQIAGRRIGLER